MIKYSISTTVSRWNIAFSDVLLNSLDMAKIKIITKESLYLSEYGDYFVTLPRIFAHLIKSSNYLEYLL